MRIRSRPEEEIKDQYLPMQSVELQDDDFDFDISGLDVDEHRLGGRSKFSEQTYKKTINPNKTYIKDWERKQSIAELGRRRR